ncbi:DMT family transporter [Paenibacillus rhizoplanae]
MHKQGLKLAYSFAVLNAVIIGFSFLFTKVALVHAGPLDTLTFRFAASFAVMSVPVALGWVKVSYRGKPIGRALLLAAMYPLGFFTLQVFGLQRATSAEGGILYSFTPVVTMIIAAIVLKEKTTLLQKAVHLPLGIRRGIHLRHEGKRHSAVQYDRDCAAVYDLSRFCRVQCAGPLPLQPLQPRRAQLPDDGGSASLPS